MNIGTKPAKAARDNARVSAQIGCLSVLDRVVKLLGRQAEKLLWDAARR